MKETKLSSCIIGAILFIAAILVVYCTWSPFLLSFYSPVPASNNGYEVPMRVVGVNFPIASLIWLGVSFIVFLVLWIVLAGKKKNSAGLFWLNGLSVSLLLAHAVMWGYLMLPV